MSAALPHPRVTLVTPTYNQGRYLAETLDCILAQDLQGLEYLVIDDGSTDDTPDVLARYADRVQSIRQPNAGQARTLNRGWEMARGDYVGYLSSDDLLEPDALRRMAEVLDACPDVICVFPNADLIDDASAVVKTNVCREFDLAELVIRQECYIGPGALFRRSAFEQAGGWKPELRLAPDREFWMRIASLGEFRFVQETLAHYRLHPASISYKEVSEAQSREYLAVLDGYFSRTDVPPAIADRKKEAYGRATLVIARNAFRSGQWRRGIALYRQACDLHAPLRAPSVKATLVRNIISKPVRALLARFKGR
jgi:glycosyltransferase involved in cell wall biosynthesis